MNIEILHLLEGADQAKGTTVVIDVFRAFSLECYLFSRGVEKIYAVGAEETARSMKKDHPDYIMVGERGGIILPGFDYGNSPSQTEHAELQGKTVIHTTSAGTQGLVHASAAGASELLTGSLVRLDAVGLFYQTLGRQTVVIKSEGVKYVESLHSLIAGHNLCLGIGEDVADVDLAIYGRGRGIN